MIVHILDANNVVINTVIADTIEEIDGGVDGSNGGIGWTLVDGVFQDLRPDTRDYDTKRKAEYPPIEDYLDGIVKGDTAQVDKYITDCLAVKLQYPKPTENN